MARTWGSWPYQSWTSTTPAVAGPDGSARWTLWSSGIIAPRSGQPARRRTLPYGHDRPPATGSPPCRATRLPRLRHPAPAAGARAGAALGRADPLPPGRLGPRQPAQHVPPVRERRGPRGGGGGPGRPRRPGPGDPRRGGG